MFDASKEQMDIFPIWVCFPGLPAEFWSKECFKEFGNALGTFLDVDMSFLSTGDLIVACILVLLNVRGGLPKDLELVVDNSSYMQKLDYEGISFQCRHCHQHGHVANDCRLPFKGHSEMCSPGGDGFLDPTRIQGQFDGYKSLG
jgi:hypothetical protein